MLNNDHWGQQSAHVEGKRCQFCREQKCAHESESSKNKPKTTYASQLSDNKTAWNISLTSVGLKSGTRRLIALLLFEAT